VDFLRKRHPQVEVLASKENVGFCIGNNRMVAQARGECILLLNNDAALLPGALAALMADARQQSPQGILTLPQFDWQTGVLVDRGCLLDPFCNPVPNLDPQRRDVAMVIGACMFMSRALWIELGGFPEWIESIGEDMYLCCAARLRGLPVQATSTSGYRHRQGASFGGNRVSEGHLRSTYRRRSLSERNKTFVLFVMSPGLAMWPLLAVHLAILAVEGLVLALLKFDPPILSRIYLPAFTALFRQRATLRARRIHEQAARKIGVPRYFATTRWFLRKFSLLWRHGMPAID